MRILLIALFLSGCATIEPTGPLSPYDAGRIHGCGSGKSAAGNWTYQFRQDVNAYTSNAHYKAGWDTWFMSCKTETEQINAITRDVVR
jgi:hypothetical protein